MRRLAVTTWVILAVVGSTPIANAGSNTKEFMQSVLSELNLTAQACHYLSPRARSIFSGVCASTDDSYRQFMERWETLPSIKKTRATSDWNSSKLRNNQGQKSTVYYRHYEAADVPFIVFYDKKEKWILMTAAVSSSTRCEETDPGTQDGSPDVRQVPSEEIDPDEIEIVSKVAPTYPWPARVMRIQGRVFSRVRVEVDGTVSDVCILEAHPPGLGFEEAAVAAIEQWRYKPVTQEGEAVAVHFTVRADFEVQ